MMKKDVAGVGICGCMTSPLWLENMIRKMRHFEGYFWLLWDSGGGTEGPGWGNYLSPMWMSFYDEEKCVWCGYLWLLDITGLKT